MSVPAVPPDARSICRPELVTPAPSPVVKSISRALASAVIVAPLATMLKVSVVGVAPSVISTFSLPVRATVKSSLTVVRPLKVEVPVTVSVESKVAAVVTLPPVIAKSPVTVNAAAESVA